MVSLLVIVVGIGVGLACDEWIKLQRRISVLEHLVIKQEIQRMHISREDGDVIDNY